MSSIHSTPIEYDGISNLTPMQADRVSQVLDTYLQRLEAGHEISIEDLLCENADISSQLQVYIQKVQWLRQFRNPYSKARNPEHTSESHDSVDQHVLGDYRLIREIGRGGMGIVFEAEHRDLHHRVALKMLPWMAGFDEHRIARFRLEAQAAASLVHSNIVPVHSIGLDRGIHFYVMPLIDGESIEQWLCCCRCERQSDHIAMNVRSRVANPYQHVASVLRGTIEIARALAFAHRSGVVHRDVKPSNLLRDLKGKFWLTDFGVARNPRGATLTKTGDIIGTHRYMSPEQARGDVDVIDGRTDQYALAATLLEMLTLSECDQWPDLSASESWVPDLLQQANVLSGASRRDLCAVIEKALAASPERRYKTLDDFGDDCERILCNRPTLARPRNRMQRLSHVIRSRTIPVLASALLILIVTVSFSYWSRADRIKQDTAILNTAAAEYDSGRMALMSGLVADALRLQMQARKQLQAVSSPQSRHRRQQLLARVLLEMGKCRIRSGQLADAGATLRSGLNEARKCLDLNDQDQALLEAEFHEHLGLVLFSLSDSSAVDEFEHGLSLLRPYERIGNQEVSRQQATLCHCLARAVRDQSPQTAIKYLENALSHFAASFANSRNDSRSIDNQQAASMRYNLALACHQDGQMQRAIDEIEQAVDVQRRLRRRTPAEMTYTRDLAASLSFLSLLQWKQEQRALSMTTICEAKDILLSLVSLGASPEIASELGCIYHNLASRQSNGDDIEPAMASCLLAQEYQRMACQWSPENKQYRQLLSRHLAMHSQFLKQQGRMSEAAELSDERTRLSDDNPQMLRLIAIELKEVAEHAYSKRQFVNAEKYRRQSTELFERADDIQRIRTGFHATAQVRIQTDEAPP